MGIQKKVPLPKSDFIAAALGEELGLVGLVGLLVLFIVIVEGGFRFPCYCVILLARCSPPVLRFPLACKCLSSSAA